jgi:hypothetical protein
LTELVSQLDVVDNNLANETNQGINQLSSFMSLSELRGDGKDQCGYNCIKLPEFFDEETNYVYEFATNISMNISIENNPEETACHVLAKSCIQRARLTRLSILSSETWNRSRNCITSNRMGAWL